MATAGVVVVRIGAVSYGSETCSEFGMKENGSCCCRSSLRGSFLCGGGNERRCSTLRPCARGNSVVPVSGFCDQTSVGARWHRRKLDGKPNSFALHLFSLRNVERSIRFYRASQQDFGFCLHDLMDQAGIDTKFARVARTGFVNEVTKLAGQDHQPAGSSSSNDAGVDMTGDLARAVLEIAAEDDALVSHSAVPLPVDMYLERVDFMAAEFAGHHLPSHDPYNPRAVLEALDNYLFVYKGFQRTTARASDPRDYYLNGVLTRRLGTPVMLGLIYSEVVKRLKLRGAIEFIARLQLPESRDDLRLPQAVVTESSPRALDDSTLNRRSAGNEAADSQNLLTSELVLSEVLRSLKSLYWPWKPENGFSEENGFLDAATAINRGPVGSGSTVHGPFESLFTAPSRSRGSEVARARAAQYRLQRGIWTSTAFGDLRCALAASERLVLLGLDKKERRDYGVLLFHCGLYEQAFKYLNFFHSGYEASPESKAQLSAQESTETAALKMLLDRLKLILTERSWDSPPQPPQPIPSPPEPW